MELHVPVPSEHIRCPCCRTEITESQPSAVCPACRTVLHIECARIYDFKCPNCLEKLVVEPGKVHIVVSGSSAEDVERVSRSLLDETLSKGSVADLKGHISDESAEAEDDENVRVGVRFGDSSDFVAKELPNLEDRRALRKWWHNILREHKRYSCYAFLLALPSDKEAIRYVNEFGKELDIISSSNCAVIALSNTGVRRSGIDEELWITAFEEHVFKGHSLKVAQLFDIELVKFPCMVLFQDIRSPEHIVISFKGMTVDEISEKMRRIFSVIQQAMSDKHNPLLVIEQHRNQENLRKKGKAIISQIRSFAGKSFETATEAWVKAIIK